MKHVLAISLMFVLVACSPSQTDIQRAIAQTQTAQPSTTPIAHPSATPTLIPLPLLQTEVLRKALLTPDDLTFAGLFQQSYWNICGVAQHFILEELQNRQDGQKTVSQEYKVGNCNDQVGNSVAYMLFILPDTRKAERFAETAKIGLEGRFSSMISFFGPYETQSLGDGEYQIWLISFPVAFEASTLVMQVDEAVFILDFSFTTKLVVADLTDLAAIAVQRLRSVQQ